MSLTLSSASFTLRNLAIITLAMISPLIAADPQPKEILLEMKRVADW